MAFSDRRSLLTIAQIDMRYALLEQLEKYKTCRQFNDEWKADQDKADAYKSRFEARSDLCTLQNVLADLLDASSTSLLGSSRLLRSYIFSALIKCLKSIKPAKSTDAIEDKLIYTVVEYLTLTEYRDVEGKNRALRYLHRLLSCQSAEALLKQVINDFIKEDSESPLETSKVLRERIGELLCAYYELTVREKVLKQASTYSVSIGSLKLFSFSPPYLQAPVNAGGRNRARRTELKRFLQVSAKLQNPSARDPRDKVGTEPLEEKQDLKSLITVRYAFFEKTLDGTARKQSKLHYKIYLNQLWDKNSKDLLEKIVSDLCQNKIPDVNVTQFITEMVLEDYMMRLAEANRSKIHNTQDLTEVIHKILKKINHMEENLENKLNDKNMSYLSKLLLEDINIDSDPTLAQTPQKQKLT